MERFGSALFSFQAFVLAKFSCHARYPPHDVTPLTTALHDDTKAQLSSNRGYNRTEELYIWVAFEGPLLPGSFDGGCLVWGRVALGTVST